MGLKQKHAAAFAKLAAAKGLTNDERNELFSVYIEEIDETSQSTALNGLDSWIEDTISD